MATSRSIDYWGIVTRSVRIAWTNKFLWFFGFFAASGGGGGGNYGGGGGDHGLDEVRDFFVSHAEVMVAIIMGLVLLWLILLVMNVISKGALVSCISRADAGESIRFEEGWRAGLKAFWGMLGITLITILVFLVVATVCVLAVVLPLIGGAAGIAIAVLIGAILFIPFIVFLFLLAFTVIYAERHYVIRGGGVGDALLAGWEMTKSYFWQSLLMWLVSLASSMAFFIALIIALLAMAIPFILIGVASPIAGLVMGIPVGIVAIILAGSAFSTYDHSLWTLMFGELTRPATAPGVPVGPDGSQDRIIPAMPLHLHGHGPDSRAGSGRSTWTKRAAPRTGATRPRPARGAIRRAAVTTKPDRGAWRPPERDMSGAGSVLTEQRNPRSAGIDTMSAVELVELINAEDATVAASVARERDRIAAAIELVVERLRRGGRLVYVGAGTSGRLGVLDAAECPPTFGTEPEMIQGVIAGGYGALVRAKEGAEDDRGAGGRDVRERNVGPDDVVMGIATSGGTPYVQGALEEAARSGAGTVFLCCTPVAEDSVPVDVTITPLTGPEVVTGSTRMKAGTATKLVLNTITTASMVLLGKTYENLMVDLMATCDKLRDRALRIMTETTGVDSETAATVLMQAGGSVKVAIVMQKSGVGLDEAERLLGEAGGLVRAALARGDEE